MQNLQTLKADCICYWIDLDLAFSQGENYSAKFYNWSLGVIEEYWWPSQQLEIGKNAKTVLLSEKRRFFFIDVKNVSVS